MPGSARALAALGACALAFAAACGGSGGGSGPVAGTPSSPMPSSSSVGTAPTSTSTTPGAGSATPMATSPGQPANPPISGPTRTIVPSTLAAELKEAGIDPKNLPPLEKLEPVKLRKVMNSFKNALGVSCSYCHDGDDMRAPTPRKRVASRMWNDLVRTTTFEDNAFLYCDSCHGGHARFLNRDDKKALAGWMDENFVNKLKPVASHASEEQSCARCHGEDLDMHFLAKWSGEIRKK